MIRSANIFKRMLFLGVAGIVLIMTVVQFTAQETPDIYYGTQLQPVNMKVKEYKGIQIYYQNDKEYNAALTALAALPETITALYENGKIFLSDKEYINKLCWKKQDEGEYHLSELWHYGMISDNSELWGYYWGNEKAITVSSILTAEQITETVIHEIAHYIDSLIPASKYLSVSQVRKLSDYTSKYSACNNPEHIGSSNDEAFAESLYFYVINKEMVKEELPAIYDYWHIFDSR